MLILRPAQMKHLYAPLWGVDLNQSHTLQEWTQHGYITCGNNAVEVITQVCICVIGVFMPASRDVSGVPFLV